MPEVPNRLCEVPTKYQQAAAPIAARLAAGGRELAAEARAVLSILPLVAANVLALLIAWLTRMSLSELMLVYLIQSLIIGITSALRIINLERFSTENLRMNNQPIAEEPASKWKVALFFLFHFGGFHVIYFMFITFDQENAPGGSRLGYLLCALVFAVNHGYSLVQNIRRDGRGKPNLGTMMFLPYARILPMHLTIIFGGLFFEGTGAFLLFSALKVVADVVMHTVEHHVLARGIAPPAGIRNL